MHLPRLRYQFLAATLACASPVQASCRFPDGSTGSPSAVAELLFASTDALGFAMVRQVRDGASGRPEEVEIGFPLKGPRGRLALRNPIVGETILATNAQTSFDAPEGALVFAALTRTPSGWVIGECTSQLLNAFPFDILMPELRQAFLKRRGK